MIQNHVSNWRAGTISDAEVLALITAEQIKLTALQAEIVNSMKWRETARAEARLERFLGGGK